jgi:hypothetical protein
VDVGDDATAGNGGFDQGIQLLVSADGQLRGEITKNTFIEDKAKINASNSVANPGCLSRIRIKTQKNGF